MRTSSSEKGVPSAVRASTNLEPSCRPSSRHSLSISSLMDSRKDGPIWIYLGELFNFGWTRWYLRPAYFIASGWPRRNSRPPFTGCLVDVCAGASMYVPITGDRVPKEAFMMPGLQMVLDLTLKLLQDSNHGRSPSEIAHHTLNASYPHHARGGVLKLSTRKFHIAPRVEKCFPLGDWRGFLNKEESYETRQTCDWREMARPWSKGRLLKNRWARRSLFL